MNRNSPHMLLAMLAALGGVGAPPRRSSDSRHISQELLAVPDTLLADLLMSRPFKGLGERGGDHVEVFKKSLAELSALDPNDIGEFIVIATRRPVAAGEKCLGCGEVHESEEDGGTQTLMASMLGESLVLEILWRLERAAGDAAHEGKRMPEGMSLHDMMRG